MTRFRFNHLFLSLLLVSATCAFLVPREPADLLRAQVDAVFLPVAYPVRLVVAAVRGERLVGEFDADRAPAEAREEIERLRSQLVNALGQIDEMRRRSAERELAGDARKYSLPFRVAGGDPGGRDALLVQATARDGLQAGMPVLNAKGVVGRVTAAGAMTARIQLITDRGFYVSGAFARLQKRKDGQGEELVRLGCSPLLEGMGGGRMGVTNLNIEQLEGAQVRPGDLLILDDPDWPLMLQGAVLGEVEQVERQARHLQWARVVVRPRVGLMQLREVMVVVGKPATAAPPVASRQPRAKG